MWQVGHLFPVSPNLAQEWFIYLEYLTEMKNNDNDEKTFLYITLGDSKHRGISQIPSLLRIFNGKYIVFFVGLKACLALSLSHSVLVLNFAQIVGFVKVCQRWISLSCWMDLSKLINGFLQVVAWIFQSC